MFTQTHTYENAFHFFGNDQKKKKASEKTGVNYSTFGASMPQRTFASDDYRYGFNGKEQDGETNTYDYGFRIYNVQLGKFLSVDPLMPAYPMYTPYHFACNRVIDGSDLDGLEWWDEKIEGVRECPEPVVTKVSVFGNAHMPSEMISYSVQCLARNFGLESLNGFQANVICGPTGILDDQTVYMLYYVDAVTHQPMKFVITEAAWSAVTRAAAQRHDALMYNSQLLVYSIILCQAAGPAMEILEVSLAEDVVVAEEAAMTEEVVIAEEAVVTAEEAVVTRAAVAEETVAAEAVGVSTAGETSTIAAAACFITGTQVAGKAGFIQIQDVAVGDSMWTYNLTTNELELNKVVSTSVLQVDHLVRLTIDDLTIIATEEHPFWNGKSWVTCRELHEGDSVFSLNSNFKVISDIDFFDSIASVYNFVIEPNHSYLITNERIVVHNGPCDQKLGFNGTANITVYENGVGTTRSARVIGNTGFAGTRPYNNVVNEIRKGGDFVASSEAEAIKYIESAFPGIKQETAGASRFGYRIDPGSSTGSGSLMNGHTGTHINYYNNGVKGTITIQAP